MPSQDIKAQYGANAAREVNEMYQLARVSEHTGGVLHALPTAKESAASGEAVRLSVCTTQFAQSSAAAACPLHCCKG